MAEVTEKNTKKQILDAYHKALREMKDRKADQLDPKAEKAKVRKVEVAEATKLENVQDVQTILGEAVKDIQEVRSLLEDKYHKLTEVDEAIVLRNQELQDLYGISAEAESLAALVDGHKILKVALDEDIYELRKSWTEEKAERAKSWTQEEKETEQEQERKIRDWEYDFERRKKEMGDRVTDALKAKERAFHEEAETKRKALDEREEVLTVREAKMDELDELVSRLKDETDTRVLEAAQAARDKAKTSYNIEVSALKKGHEAEVTVLTARADTLLGQVRELREENIELSTKLNEAYTKIQDVALKSLESQGNSRMVEMSRSMASEQPRQGKN